MKKLRRKEPDLSDLDAKLAAWAQMDAAFVRPEGGWLRSVRASLGISQREAAAAAGVTQQAFNQFESGELKATITLERLQNAAAALGCEVVYFLRPAGAQGTTFGALADRHDGGVTPAAPPKSAPSRPAFHESEELPVTLL